MKTINTPISDSVTASLNIGDMVSINGYIYCARDAVLPKICKLIDENKLVEYNIDLNGSVIFHTAVSPAGIGPTSSNKLEIENSFIPLSKAGVKMHLGKGAISNKTIEGITENNAVFAVIPPVTALLGKNTLESELLAFPELGMEALYRLKVKDFPAIIAAAKNESIY